MEKQNNQSQPTIKESWFAGYIVAVLTFILMGGFSSRLYFTSFPQKFLKTSTDEFIILVLAIGAGFFYHLLKRKIKIKYEIVRIIITFIVLVMISGFLADHLTRLF